MKTAKEKIREGVMKYLEDMKEELGFDSIEELVSDRFGTCYYRDDVDYEMYEMLESEYLDWLGLSTNTIGSDSAPYVIVFGRIESKKPHRIIVNESKNVDEFVFDSVDDIVDWIDEMYGDFLTIQEELKAHYLQ